jgi:hypothetical protein
VSKNSLFDEVAVISNYNNDPKSLIAKFNTVFLYDQSDQIYFQRLINQSYPGSIKTENSGHSLSNYFKFIIDNYYSLPFRIHFLKSNVVPRHISENSLIRKLDLSGVVPIFDDDNFIDKSRIAYHLFPGYFIERNNSWFVKNADPKYFASCNDLLKYMFKNPIMPEYLLFAPGGNYSTYGRPLTLYPLNFWKFLYYITTYQYFPHEAYLVERLLFIIFSAEYQINWENFDDSWSEKLELRRENSVQDNGTRKRVKGSWLTRKFLSKTIFELEKRGFI